MVDQYTCNECGLVNRERSDKTELRLYCSNCDETTKHTK